MADEGAVVAAEPIVNTPVSTEAASSAPATPVAQEPVSTPAAEPIAAATVETQPSVLDRIKRAGFNFSTEEELIAGLAAFRENAPAWRQGFEEYQKVRPHLSQFEQWMAERNKPAPPAPPAEDPLAPPKIDRGLLAHYTVTNAEGRRVLSPEAPAELRQQIDKYRLWKAQRDEQWDADPDSYIKSRGYIHKDDFQKQIGELEAKFNQRVEQEFQARELQKQSAAVLDARRSQVLDAAGNTTAYGRAYLAAVDKAENVYGMQNPRDVDEYADAMASKMTFAAQTSAAQAEQQIRRAAGIPAAVSATPVRVSPSQANPGQPAFPTIADAVKAAWPDIEKEVGR